MKILKHFLIIGSVFLTGSLLTVMSSCTDDNVGEETSGDTDNTEEPDPEFIKTCQVIMDRVKADNTGSSSGDNSVEEYLNNIRENGSFPDVDYSDKSFSWKPMTHLNRLKQMAQAYVLPESRFFENEKAYTSIVNALTYWNSVHPTCDNWYENQIRAPKSIGETLVLLRYGKVGVPEELEDSICSYWKQTGGNPAEQPLGSNKSDIALHWLYRGILQQDKNVVETAAFHLFRSLEYVTPDEEGIQQDLSILQHGPQLYIGGYGLELLKGVTKAAVYFAETEYALSPNQRRLLYRFVNETYMESIRGKHQFYNVVGRSVSRKGALDCSGFTSILEKMKQIDSEHTQDYDLSINILKGQTGYESYTKKLNHYYIADYMSVRNTNYSANVRLSSTRTYKAENGNGENLKSYFMSDGSTDVAITGDEYSDIFPVWDWCRVPGVTNPYMRTIPLADSWGIRGESTFCGGLGDGYDGLSAFDMVYNSNNIDMSAKKSYFFIGDEIVCLGSGITSKMSENINTTVEQCLKKTDVWYSVSGQENQVSGLVNNVDVDWVWHGNIGYFFPKNDLVSIREEERVGKWSDINTSGSTGVVKKDVCTIWFDHGSRPSDSKNTYCYVIVPNIDKDNMGNYKNKVEIISNTPELQAISNLDKSVLQAIFYKGGTVDVQGIKVTVDNPCALMVKKDGENAFRLYFSDPSHRLKSLNISLEYNGKTQVYSYSDFNADNIYKGITHQAVLSF